MQFFQLSVHILLLHYYTFYILYIIFTFYYGQYCRNLHKMKWNFVAVSAFPLLLLLRCCTQSNF